MRGGPALETEDDGDGYGLGSRLASREVDILTLVSGGLRNREIGDRLGLTEGPVQWSMSPIYVKLGVRGRPQAGKRARRSAERCVGNERERKCRYRGAPTHY